MFKKMMSDLRGKRKILLKAKIFGGTSYIELSTLDKWRQFDKNEYVLSLYYEEQDLYLSVKQDISESGKGFNEISIFIKEVEKYYKETKENLKIMKRFFMTISIKMTKIIYSNKYNQFYHKPLLNIEYFYTSPKGRNKYRNKDNIYLRDIKKVIKDIEKRNKYEKTNKHQRDLMTAGLRYDILKRDNYMCQICGATSETGAKLHVDHIKPISKGGLTEKSNLQTLCETCNLGKSNKY